MKLWLINLFLSYFNLSIPSHISVSLLTSLLILSCLICFPHRLKEVSPGASEGEMCLLSPSARLLSGTQRFNFHRFRILTTHPVTRHYTNRPKFKHLCYKPSCGITLWLPIWLDIVVVPADTCSNLFHFFSSPNAFWLARHSSEITKQNAYGMCPQSWLLI